MLCAAREMKCQNSVLPTVVSNCIMDGRKIFYEWGGTGDYLNFG